MSKARDILVIIVIVTLFIAVAKAYRLETSLKFGVNLYTAALGENPRENVIISPLSVQAALGLVAMGANGTTAEQIVTGLSLLTSRRSNLSYHFREIQARYNGDDKLKLANKVYLKDGYQLSPQFDETVKTLYRSEPETINFAESDAAARSINSWVENRTNGNIKDLISSGSLTDDTGMVIINAAHFKASWHKRFANRYTEKRDFWISETESVQVDTMHSDVFGIYHQNTNLDAQIIQIPYKDTDLSMVIFLPNSRMGLQDMVNKLRNYDFASLSFDLSDQLRNHDFASLSFDLSDSYVIKLFLPKFKIESNVDLKMVLKKMGIVDMFTDASSFPLLFNSNERLKVDDVVHKTLISVDEDGAGGAAAEGFIFRINRTRPNTIRVDHPFLFAIMNAKDVAFIGSVRNL